VGRGPASLTRTPERLVQTAEYGRAVAGQVASVRAIKAGLSSRMVVCSRACGWRGEGR